MRSKLDRQIEKERAEMRAAEARKAPSLTPLEKELVEALEKVVACLNGDAPAFDLRVSEPKFRSLLARAKQTGTHEFTVEDDGHGRAMVGGRRLAYGGAGLGIGDLWITTENYPAIRIQSGLRVRVELRDGCDFATLVEVL